jgi:uncharacterized protein
MPGCRHVFGFGFGPLQERGFDMGHAVLPLQVMATDLVVLQPTSFCNIDCKYCYLSSRHVKNTMSMETIQKIVEWLLDSKNLARDITISWHAGEPFVLPAEYFEEGFGAFQRLEWSGHTVHHSVQTNAILVRDEHCRVLQKFRSNVGVSLDGPQNIHDQFRVNRRGGGTFSDVVKGIKRLKSYEIPLSAIAVVGPETFTDPDGFYACFKDLGIPIVGINLQEIEGTNGSSYISDESYAQSYRSFLKQLFMLSCTDGEVAIRELVNTMRTILSAGTPQVSSEADAGRILSFSADGRVSTFSPELLDQTNSRLGRLSFGPIDAISFEDLLRNSRFSEIYNEVLQGVLRCRSECRYFSVCGGGGPSNKLGECGRADITETHACRMGRKAVTDVALELLEERPELVGRAWETWWMKSFFAQPSSIDASQVQI